MFEELAPNMAEGMVLKGKLHHELMYTLWIRIRDRPCNFRNIFLPRKDEYSVQYQQTYKETNINTHTHTHTHAYTETHTHIHEHR